MATHSAEDDAKSIDQKFTELRRDIGEYPKRHGKFYPGIFDGPPLVPRPDLLTNCRVLHDRLEIVRRLPPGGIFAELGTMTGDFIVKVLEIYRPAQVHIFDFGFNNLRDSNRAAINAYNNAQLHVGDSSTKLSELPDRYFDVIYVDADHSYDGVWKDLQQSMKKIKAGGYIVCNDYTNFDPIQMVPYGVYAAVNRLANENNLTFEFIALAAMGFHDVALRCP